MSEKILVTSALPYANGPIHLGHLAGCYLPADIYVRYQRLKGRDVIHICGTDENGVPITLTAEREGVSPKDIVDRYYENIKESFSNFGISFDNFSRTSIPLHHKTAQDFFSRIFDKGYIFPRETTQLFCPSCRRFLADRYVEGTCPNCGFAEARGDQCEACGRWLEPTLLQDPRCKICGGSPEVRKTTHWFFSLDQFQNPLENWLSAKPSWKENVRKFCEGWFKTGLEPRSITRDLPWGVPVPLKEAEEKVLYVWFDAPIGYISSTIEWAKDKGEPDLWKDYWLSPETKLVHFIGKDNIVFHAMVWPAMLMAHGEYILPSEIPANEFLNIEGQAMSTSRNWAIWLPEYLEEFEPDPLRYCLALNAPETRDSDFTWRDFQARLNNELADILGNLVNRTMAFIFRYYQGSVPKRHRLRSQDTKVLGELRESKKDVGDLLETFKVKKALREVMDLAKAGNRYFDHSRVWETRENEPDRCETSLSVLLQLVNGLSTLIEPFLPFTAEKIRGMLRTDSVGWDDAAGSPVPEGSELAQPEILFRKVEDEVIDIQREKLGRREETMPEITMEDFDRFDLRVAEILSAELVRGTKRLLRLEVDLGEEKRQIVSGIGETYKPAQLVGRQIVLIANLKPAVIHGIESKGMLLAAVDGKRIALVVPQKRVSKGCRVS